MTILEFVAECKGRWVPLSFEKQAERADKSKLCMFFYSEVNPSKDPEFQVDLFLTSVTVKWDGAEWIKVAE